MSALWRTLKEQVHGLYNTYQLNQNLWVKVQQPLKLANISKWLRNIENNLSHVTHGRRQASNHSNPQCLEVILDFSWTREPIIYLSCLTVLRIIYSHYNLDTPQLHWEDNWIKTFKIINKIIQADTL